MLLTRMCVCVCVCVCESEFQFLNLPVDFHKTCYEIYAKACAVFSNVFLDSVITL